MSTCPHCQRKLLSQASACCNWCGQEITDPAYQQQAQAEREAYFTHQAAHDAASLAQIEAINVGPWLSPMDPLTGLPGRAVWSRRMPDSMPVPTPTKTPQAGSTYPTIEPPAEEKASEDTPGDRFRHLEL